MACVDLRLECSAYCLAARSGTEPKCPGDRDMCSKTSLSLLVVVIVCNQLSSIKIKTSSFITPLGTDFCYNLMIFTILNCKLNFEKTSFPCCAAVMKNVLGCNVY